jgi:hypothetical protein
VAQPVMRREPLPQRPFAGSGRTVDGDDHLAGITVDEGRSALV